VAGITSGGSSDACLVTDDSYDARIATYASFIQAARGSDSSGVCSSLPVVGSAETTVTSFAGTLGITTPQGTHTLNVAAGVALLRVTMNAVDDGSDFDLYVRAGTPPTSAAYDCAAKGAGQFAACEFTAPATGPWYVLIDRYTGGGDYQVTAT